MTCLEKLNHLLLHSPHPTPPLSLFFFCLSRIFLVGLQILFMKKYWIFLFFTLKNAINAFSWMVVPKLPLLTNRKSHLRGALFSYFRKDTMEERTAAVEKHITLPITHLNLGYHSFTAYVR